MAMGAGPIHCCEASGPREPTTSPVTLNVYDLGQGICKVNEVLRPMGTGVFHCGIEVFWLEVSFGVHGIYFYSPRQARHHLYRESQRLGTTQLYYEQFVNLMARMGKTWNGQKYNVMRNNCCHFCQALSFVLGVSGIPDWVCSMADVGSSLADAPNQVRAVVCATVGCGCTQQHGHSASVVDEMPGEFDLGMSRSPSRNSHPPWMSSRAAPSLSPRSPGSPPSFGPRLGGGVGGAGRHRGGRPARADPLEAEHFYSRREVTSRVY